MVRYKPGHAAETHARIVEQASAMMRERGLAGASVAEVMRAAGLTVGGFYAQFADKEAMLAEAMEHAFGPSRARFGFLAEAARRAERPGLVAEKYLSDERVADVAGGCVAAALAGELHRAAPPVREAFAEGAVECAAILGEPGWAQLALLVGALALLRAMPEGGPREALRDAAVEGYARLAD
jgi:TetR/AcrR family transcriptional regulator, transcriptional repressor for nem operon